MDQILKITRQADYRPQVTQTLDSVDNSYLGIANLPKIPRFVNAVGLGKPYLVYKVQLTSSVIIFGISDTLRCCESYGVNCLTPTEILGAGLLSIDTKKEYVKDDEGSGNHTFNNTLVLVTTKGIHTITASNTYDSSFSDGSHSHTTLLEIWDDKMTNRRDYRLMEEHQ